MKILLAVDGSPSSDAAAEAVASRPWPAGSEIRVITVDAPIDSGIFSPSAFDELALKMREEAVARLKRATDLLEQGGTTLPITPVLREGWPKEAILDEAEQWGADLIVVGSHGRGMLRRALLGSVSQAVATNASCSVEIVRRPADT